MKKKLIIIIAAAVVLIGAGAAVFLFVLPKGEQEEPQYRSTYTPGDYFITNVKGSKNLVKTTVVLEVNVLESDKLYAELAPKNHIIRETIVMILRSHNYDELMSVDTRDANNFLNLEITQQLNERLAIEGLEITRIYLFDYVVQ